MNITDTTMGFETLKLCADDFENPRSQSGLSDEEIRETANSIVKHGLLVPLLVRPDGVVIAGKRRYWALTRITMWLGGTDVGIDCQLTSELKHDWLYKLARIPVRVVSLVMGDELDYQAFALVDNLFRSDLSSYEIATALVHLSEENTGAEIARKIGKSPAYVSRKLSAWRRASEELLAAWRDGMPEDTVEVMGKLSPEDQAKALAGPIPRGRRGPAHRPSVDAQRDFLHALEQRPAPPVGLLAKQRAPAIDHAYRSGVVDALRWATGAQVGPEFVQLAEPRE